MSSATNWNELIIHEMSIHGSIEMSEAMGVAMKGVMNRGKPLMVFDWDMAAQIIKARGEDYALAGLHGDWDHTVVPIYADGHPVIDEAGRLASTWAHPMLQVDGDLIDCYRMEDNVPEEWLNGFENYCDIRWPQSAIDVLGEREL